MTASALDYRIENDADGTVRVLFKKGHRVTLKDDGVCADLASIAAVGIRHLNELASHSFNTIAGSRSHVIRFVNGSLLRYAYNSAGQLIELSARNLRCGISKVNEVLFQLP